jgi:hypothetical protein
MWLIAAPLLPPSQRTWHDLSNSIAFIYFPPGYFKFASSETMLTLRSRSLVNGSSDCPQCPGQINCPNHMSSEQILCPKPTSAPIKVMAQHSYHAPSLIGSYPCPIHQYPDLRCKDRAVSWVPKGQYRPISYSAQWNWSVTSIQGSQRPDETSPSSQGPITLDTGHHLHGIRSNKVSPSAKCHISPGH